MLWIFSNDPRARFSQLLTLWIEITKPHSSISHVTGMAASELTWFSVKATVRGYHASCLLDCCFFSPARTQPWTWWVTNLPMHRHNSQAEISASMTWKARERCARVFHSTCTILLVDSEPRSTYFQGSMCHSISKVHHRLRTYAAIKFSQLRLSLLLCTKWTRDAIASALHWRPERRARSFRSRVVLLSFLIPALFLSFL